MNGVEILASSQVLIDVAFNWSAFWIVFSIFTVVSLFLGLILGSINNDCVVLIILVIVGMALGCVWGGVAGFEYATPAEYETQYKVTISDEVQMNGFLERYEILDQEGKIYTVRERLKK